MVTNIDRLLDVANDDLRYENPLAYVLTFGVFRADLAAAVSATTGVSVTGESAVPRYPLETQAEASDHIVPRAVNIVLTGFVNDGDVEGSAEGVISEFERIRKEGVLVTVGVPSDVFDNCVVKRVTTTRNASTGRAYQVSVEFEQVLLGTAVALPQFDAASQPGPTNTDLLIAEEYLKLVGTVSDVAEAQRIIDNLDPDRPLSPLDEALLFVSGYAVDSTRVYSTQLTQAEVVALRSRIAEAANDGMTAPNVPNQFIARTNGARNSTQFGFDSTLPIIGQDAWQVGGVTNAPTQLLETTMGGRRYRLALKYVRQTDATGSYTSASSVWRLMVHRFEQGFAVVDAGETTIQTNVPIGVTGGAFMAIPIAGQDRGFREMPWGNTHQLYFVNSTDFLEEEY